MPKPSAHPPIALSKKMTLEDAFKVMAFSCITQVETNATALAKTYDIENLHQMRVGLRRFNSLLKFYHEILPLPETLKLELAWLNQQLSATRDWDVFVHATLPALSNQLSYLATFAEVCLTANDIAEEKHQQLTVMVNSKRYAKLIVSLEKFLLMRGWRALMSSQAQTQLLKKLNKTASTSLTQQRKILMNLGKRINVAKRKKVHLIRIAAKQLRYTAEFLQSLYSAKKARVYIKNLAKLQDVLGMFNDAVVANRLLKEIESTDTILQSEMEIILLALNAKAEIKHQKMDALWRDFVLRTPFWEEVD